MSATPDLPDAAPIPSQVLLLCWRDTGHPQGGGSELYLQRVGQRLAERGATVTLLTAAYPGAPAVEIRDGVRIVRAGGRLSVYPRALATIVAGRFGRGPLADFSPELVVDTQNGVPFFATVASAAPTLVLVHHCHREQWPVAGPLLSRIGWFIESRLSPLVHRRSQYVTVSAPSAAELVELGVDAERVTVVRAGIDPLPVTPRPPSDDAVHLVTLSRLVPHKQIDHALEVIAQLRRSHPQIVLDIIGGGWWDDRLRTRATELDVADRVTFHGHVTDERKHELLSGAHLHLMPSQKEGWGIAVIEAAQHAVPTIGYRHAAGLRESIAHDETGFLVDSVDELVSATRKLVDDPASARRLGDAAYQRAQDYSWESTTDGIIAAAGRATSRRLR
ncbi:glycosyltransferase family 4 protein [Gordonia sp. TBRC 11910]|uniref:Glycosyltransferase family 4 protein n=1 Tax=Gordonia asplenii TaxID=2725283 RepID=A0A848L1I4_9ACTN|nr:glycosyltransferase family 4 protein [Gordonia asplenii]NMO02473.1 glycosyltransferase family 4 protein [Gordonia asplenii]